MPQGDKDKNDKFLYKIAIKIKHNSNVKIAIKVTLYPKVTLGALFMYIPSLMPSYKVHKINIILFIGMHYCMLLYYIVLQYTQEKVSF